MHYRHGNDEIISIHWRLAAAEVCERIIMKKKKNLTKPVSNVDVLVSNGKLICMRTIDRLILLFIFGENRYDEFRGIPMNALQCPCGFVHFLFI